MASTKTATVKLTPSNLDNARRASIEYLAEDLRNAADQLDQLVTRLDMADGVLAADAKNTCRRVREGLSTLDSFGWPEPRRAASAA